MLSYISEKNLIQHEFIGLQTTIIDSPCKTLMNIKGQIIDETMNTFTIEYNADGKHKIISVPKHKNIFRITIPKSNNTNTETRTVNIEGTILTKRPEDRIKKLAKLANKMNKDPAKQPAIRRAK